MKKNHPLIFESQYKAATPIAIQTFLRETARFSGRSLRKFFFRGLIEINQKKAHSAASIKPGDQIRVYQLEEQTGSLIPEAVPIDIIFENDDLLILNKPALVAVHPSGPITSGTLSNYVASYFGQQGYRLKVRPVNRLDYGTSGLIIFAKSASSQNQLSEALQNHRIARIYYAIVQGKPVENEGTIDLPIIEGNGRRRVDPHGKQAITKYRVIESFSNSSLIELSLLSGRTHQIRIHLKYIQCPIIGDKQYGIKSPKIKRPALHAGKLVFNDPQFSIPELTVALPQDMRELLAVYKRSE